MRARALDAELYSSDDEQPYSYNSKTPAATASSKRPSNPGGDTPPAKGYDFEQSQPEPTRPSSQSQEDSTNPASHNSMYPAFQNKVPVSEREKTATLMIEAHYQNYQEEMAKYDSEQGKIPKGREERREHILRNLCS